MFYSDGTLVNIDKNESAETPLVSFFTEDLLPWDTINFARFWNLKKLSLRSIEWLSPTVRSFYFIFHFVAFPGASDSLFNVT